MGLAGCVAAWLRPQASHAAPRSLRLPLPPQNPFGVHPCKFPLRAYAIDHIRQTRAMLVDPAKREPAAMATIFTQPPPARDDPADPGAARRTGDLAELAAESMAAHAAGDGGVGGARDPRMAIPEAGTMTEAVQLALRRQQERRAAELAAESEASLL